MVPEGLGYNPFPRFLQSNASEVVGRGAASRIAKVTATNKIEILNSIIPSSRYLTRQITFFLLTKCE